MGRNSLDRLHYRVSEAADKFEPNTAPRKAFANHLQIVAEALKKIEAVEEGDMSMGDENDAIVACVGESAILDAAIERAKDASKELQSLLEKASAGQ